jgi:propanol-preferring alcohol dehydrogenase
MTAARLHAAGEPLRIEEVQVPMPGEGEALVRVLAAGVCGSDAHMLHGRVPVAKTPIILGHEIAGMVAAVGPDAGVGLGQAVIVRAGAACGRCAACGAGDDNLCPYQKVLGMAEDGGFAQYVRAPASCLVPLPEGVSFEIGAILADAVATPYHALAVRGGLKEGESVFVVGAGGVGLHAVLLARAMGAGQVVASDVRPQALQRAREMGADETLPAEEAAYKEVQRLTGGGADIVLDCVGQPETTTLALRSLRPGGRAVVLGMGQRPLSLPPPMLFAWRELSVIGSFGSTRRDLDQVVDMVLSGRLDLSRSVTARLPLREANAALAQLDDPGGDHIRIVLSPWEEG